MKNGPKGEAAAKRVVTGAPAETSQKLSPFTTPFTARFAALHEWRPAIHRRDHAGVSPRVIWRAHARTLVSMVNPLGPNDPTLTLFDGLRRLRSTWPARGWSWDNRFICVASTFTVPFEPAARKAAAEALPAEWTSTTIGQASPQLRDLSTRTGGLRAGQLLLTSTPAGGILAFGLWWPWGDGETISMRVGLLDVDPAREPYRRLRDVFNVTL